MKKLMILAICCVMAVLTVAPASGAIISEVIFAIEAEGGGGNSTFDVPLTSGNINGDTLTWELTQPTPLLDDNGNQIALLEMASVRYVADPIVVINFLVSTGGAAANFTVTSANLSFAGINNAVGRASSAVTVTDFGGDGASLSGNFPNNDTYRAFYNDPGNVAATGTTFATLTPGIISSPNSSATSTEGFPDNAGTFSSMDESGGSLGTVSSMSAQWAFSVSQNDSASGTSIFIVVPEPASCLLCLCGIAALAFVRRR
jgi:hypothetical protein